MAELKAVEQFTLEQEPEESKASEAATEVLMVALKGLSHRAVASMATMVSVGVVFWLYLSIPSPNAYQLIELGMFSVFIVALNVLVRGKIGIR